MPIYEYRCKDCETVFETFVSSIPDADKVVCKKCESRNVEKQISTFAFFLSMTFQGPGLAPLTYKGCQFSTI
jgi:putative FmdB family regulatory protein